MADGTAPDCLVIGIDFGTTFSGVAAAYSVNPESPDEINVIKTWPGGHGITSEKVPSEMTYGSLEDTKTGRKFVNESADDDTWSILSITDTFDLSSVDSALGNGANSPSSLDAGRDQPRWGFQVRPDEQRIRCMKLFLDPRQPMPSFLSLSDTQAQLTKSGKDIHDVIVDYLKALFNHTKEILVRRYGRVFVASTALKIVLTVPAVWSDAAKDATFRAAKKAGMGSNIHMISEPEAAAVYSLQSIQPNHLKVGNNFIVVDAGGGTVDLISYKIKQLTPLRIEESAPGDGGCCGAAFLNVHFEELVRSKIGGKAFQKLKQKKPKTWLSALKYFEDYVKRNFDPNEPTTFNIPLPGVPDEVECGLEDGFLTMTHAEVGSIFTPVIKQIIELVENQVNRLSAGGTTANAILLVGGFGQSECLLKCLRARFSGKQGIEVMQPVNAWTAVVRGAVLRGLAGAELVLDRKARRHYGVKFHSIFNPAIHPASSKYWDDVGERWLSRDCMQWYIMKGQTVSATEPILFSFWWMFPMSQDHKQTKVLQLVVCDDDDAPVYFSDVLGAPTKTLCKIVVNLSSVPAHLWIERINSKGCRYCSLDFQMGMQVESGGLRFDLRVDGVVYGKVVATFD